MSTTRNSIALLKTQLNEAVKEAITYDAQGRMEFHYICGADARDGDPCLVTQYAYINANSSLIVYRKETVGMWDTTWEVF